MEKFRVRHAKHAVPHYLYDLSLPLAERMNKRMWFASGMALAAHLGVSPQRLYENREPGRRIWSDAQQGWFAVRIASNKTATIQ